MLASTAELPCIPELPHSRFPAPFERRYIQLLARLTGHIGLIDVALVTLTREPTAALALPAHVFHPERSAEALSCWLRAIATHTCASPSALLQRIPPGAILSWRAAWAGANFRSAV